VTSFQDESVVVLDISALADGYVSVCQTTDGVGTNLAVICKIRIIVISQVENCVGDVRKCQCVH
jgi:hypothetical protein